MLEDFVQRLTGRVSGRVDEAFGKHRMRSVPDIAGIAGPGGNLSSAKAWTKSFPQRHKTLRRANFVSGKAIGEERRGPRFLDRLPQVILWDSQGAPALVLGRKSRQRHFAQRKRGLGHY